MHIISVKDLYKVLTGVVPLYVAMFLAYGSIRWWKIFSLDQCSGIHRFVFIFAIPLLAFQIISSNDPYKMNFRFIAADTLQKIIILVVLGIWAKFTKNGSLEWMITIFSLSSLPNTLVMGIPLLEGMYDKDSKNLTTQILVLQSFVWNTLLLVLFEYHAAKISIMKQFPEAAASIASLQVDSDAVSLDGREFFQTDADIGGDGNIHVSALTPQASNLTSDFSSMIRSQSFPGSQSNFGAADMTCVHSSPGQTPRPSNFVENCAPNPVHGAKEIRMLVADHPRNKEATSNSEDFGRGEVMGEGEEGREKEGLDGFPNLGSPIPTAEHHPKGGGTGRRMPPAFVMTRLILITVWCKLIRSPRTSSCLLALVWSLVAGRWHLSMPVIIKDSIEILSDCGIGMAMFDLGLFMGFQPKIIACGNSVATFAMAVRFLVGPAVMALTSIALGIRGRLLHVAIIHAALPTGIAPFVFAKEYNVHPAIISTSVVFGMLVALPVTLIYYIFLQFDHP